MIKVGDKVKFLNDVGGGIVTGFIGKNMVNVENEDGFEIPYPISQLVNVNAPEMNKNERKQPIQKQKEEILAQKDEPKSGETITGKDSPDFYFCFVPTNPGNPLEGEIELYLVNDSNFTLMYHYSHHKPQSVRTVKFGNILSNSRLLLESIVQNDLNELPDFGFRLIYFKDEEMEWNDSISKIFKVNPVKFYKETSFQSNPYFQTNALVLQITKNILTTEVDKLTQHDLKKVIKEKEFKLSSAPKTKKPADDEVVIDLHITELLDQPEGLSSREILGIQMDKVESEMQSAIRSGVKRIVFIHGVGQGVLKQEVASLLSKKFKKYYFQDASFKEYGYGATMVILRRK